jgi:acetolactate synthase I/III small subunit
LFYGDFLPDKQSGPQAMDLKRSNSAPSEADTTSLTAGDRTHLATFIVRLDDGPGVLERIAGLIRRRGFQIRSITAERTDMPGALRMTLLVEANQSRAAQLEANLRKLPNFVSVDNVSAALCSLRALALIKVAATRDERPEIMQIASVFRSRVIDVCGGSMTIESTGSEGKIDRLVEVLGSYGILDMARTGPVAMIRGEKQVKADT